ncbi:MAG: potassium uptake protein, Kup system [Acidobacteria bacterium]|nr:potassium uptake protein, Kup system [Acidobacteriota bacterium]
MMRVGAIGWYQRAILALRMTAQGDASGRSTLIPLTLTAIGVVYGDIGTSPIYTVRECFFGPHAVAPTHDNVLGVLSLILYALVIVVSIKYISIVMRADNQGEGGILALTALLPDSTGTPSRGRLAADRPVLIALGIFGAALLYGDGMITPAITVLGAIEGLQVATPLFSPYVLPLSVAIIIGIFVIQQFGTHRVGGLFGPVMVVWFATIGVLGISWVVREPAVLGALDPRHGVRYFLDNGWHGFPVLGAVVLAVTGGEALYADMGHFGKRPIRLAWYGLVLPTLMLNYFGQGALILLNPAAASQPFFLMAPGWALYPLVVISTLAAIIASQALISGAFSLTRQAVLLGYAPRLDIAHTSPNEMGQVYVPQVNWALAICTILIVLGFQSSSALAATYGIALTITMVITALLLYVVATERWKWPLWVAIAVTAVFLTIDVALFAANSLKILRGGWLPLGVATIIFTLMTTWKTGRRLVAERLTARAVPMEDFIAGIVAARPARVPGTAVFMTAQPAGTPPALVHNLRYNKVLHEHVVILTVTTAHTPHVPPEDQITVDALGHGLFNMRVRYGFMQDPHVPNALVRARALGLVLDPGDVTYFLGRETIIVARRKGMAQWRERLFVLMARNAVRATAFFRLPTERVVELGVQVEM